MVQPLEENWFWPVSASFLFALAKNMCSIQGELAPAHITTKFIYSKVNMTFSSCPGVIPFPSDFSFSFCSSSLKDPQKHSS